MMVRGFDDFLTSAVSLLSRDMAAGSGGDDVYTYAGRSDKSGVDLGTDHEKAFGFYERRGKVRSENDTYDRCRVPAFDILHVLN